MRVIGAIVGILSCIALSVSVYAWYAGDLQIETKNSDGKATFQIEVIKHNRRP